MNRATTFAAMALLSSGLSLPAASLAKSPRMQPVPLWGYVSPPPPNVTSDDETAFAHNKLSIVQAIEAVNRGQDGKVIEIGFVSHKEIKAFDAVVGSSSGLHYVRINPINGQVSSRRRPDVTRADLDSEGLRDLATLGSARISLMKAVGLAQALTGGPAIAAGIEQLGGVPQYYVQTIIQKKLASIIINPETGHAAKPD